MKSIEIRKKWLNFFESKGHKIEKSVPLIPINDNTLLWINSGVAGLKKYFDGTIVPSNKRLVNVQKCIRTNDIENVGNTSRHHTFFEMLGNFSIGDYFKEDAIKWALELLTSKKYFNLDINKLYFTVYYNDEEAISIWKKNGIPENKIIRMKSNYWEIGEGPSGPNSEIFYDRGEKYDKRGIELIENDIDNDRFIEIWNIVFSQYNAKENVRREDYEELPNKNIDTGAGLERFACILQNVDTNFDTDLFMPIINKIENISGITYKSQKEFKIIADHIKTITMATHDGGMFSNEGRGYVLRRLLRRSLKYARNLNLKKPFLYKLIDSVYLILQDFYNLDLNKLEIIKKMVMKEEESFLETLVYGEKKFYEILEHSKDIISGKDAFMLYDTFGFPIELTEEYALENNFKVNIEEFNNYLNIQRLNAKNSKNKESSMNIQDEKYLKFNDQSNFIGYDTYEIKTKVIKIFEEGIILKDTPFYATMGGQICDKGTINNIEVENVIKLPNKQHLHILDTSSFKENDEVLAKIDVEHRFNVSKNHSATHILHLALKKELGDHVNQQGSNVNDNILRFDFNNYFDITDLNILNIEKKVKDYIKSSYDVIIKEMSLEDSKKINANALFNEKYDDIVRVVFINESIELCGGTHVQNTKDLVDFSVLDYYKIGSGIYRIEATCNKIKDNLILKTKHINNDIINIKEKIKDFDIKINAKSNNYDIIENDLILSYKFVINRRLNLLDYKEKLVNKEKEYKKYLVEKELENIGLYFNQKINNFIVIKTKDIDKNSLKHLADRLLEKLGNGLVFISNVVDNKIVFVCKNNIDFDSGYLVKKAAVITEGNGGGKKDFAQAGGNNIDKLEDAIKEIKGILKI